MRIDTESPLLLPDEKEAVDKIVARSTGADARPSTSSGLRQTNNRGRTKLTLPMHRGGRAMDKTELWSDYTPPDKDRQDILDYCRGDNEKMQYTTTVAPWVPTGPIMPGPYTGENPNEPGFHDAWAAAWEAGKQLLAEKKAGDLTPR